MILYSVSYLGDAMDHPQNGPLTGVGSRTTKCQMPSRSQLSAGAYDLLSCLLQETTGILNSEWQFSKDQMGKPHAFTEHSDCLPEVSVSHSGCWVGAAVSRIGAVGIDIERIRPGRDVRGLADLAFGKAERGAVERSGDDAFYRIWTLREAMAKAIGAGLSMVVDRQDRVPVIPTTGPWMTVMDGRRWLLMHRRPADALHLAVAVAVAAA